MKSSRETFYVALKSCANKEFGDQHFWLAWLCMFSRCLMKYEVIRESAKKEDKWFLWTNLRWTFVERLSVQKSVADLVRTSKVICYSLCNNLWSWRRWLLVFSKFNECQRQKNQHSKQTLRDLVWNRSPATLLIFQKCLQTSLSLFAFLLSSCQLSLNNLLMCQRICRMCRDREEKAWKTWRNDERINKLT